MATPKKTVHWGTVNSFSDTADSPSFSSTNSDYSSSTLEYVNAQLVARGFAPPPGLSLDGVSNTNTERIAKCLLELLGQRTNDMARTEDLSTKLRVLQYDYERLQSMHHTAQGNAENAERETNLHKSRLAAANRALQTAGAAHKQTSAELQRARSSLQTIRATHQTELKKKEREVERMVERWSKISDVQSKLSTVPAGITCANAEIVDGAESLSQSQGFLEVALEQAEQARGQVSIENVRLKKLVLRTVNQLHALIFRVHNPGTGEEPPDVTMDSIFPFNPPDAAEQRVTMMINDFENTLVSASSQPRLYPAQEVEQPSNPRHQAEVARLEDTIDSLRREIQRLQAESSTQLQEAQTLFEKYAQKNEQLIVNVEHAGVQEKEKLNQATRGLERERSALAEAAKILQRDKAAFEAEKVSWDAQKMMVDPPPISEPAIGAPIHSSNAAPRRASPQKQRVQKKSQGKSPLKTFKVGKSNRRRAVTAAQVREALASPAKKVIPSYQTEVIPVPAITVTGTSKHAGASCLSPGKALLTTSFALPPPSPEASLPAHPMNLGHPIPPPQFLAPFSLPKLHESSSPELSDAHSSSHTPFESPPGMDENNALSQPPDRTFPVAKPLAQRMVHAYSPVKPSPLSRVLVSASPSDSSSDGLGSSSTGPRKASMASRGEEHDPMPPFPSNAEQKDEELTLAQQLGIPDSPPDPSLKRKRVNSNGSTEGARHRHKTSSSRTQTAQVPARTTGKGRASVRDSHTSSAAAVKKKGKAGTGSVDAASDMGASSKHRGTAREASSSSSAAASSSGAAERRKSTRQAEKENKHDEGDGKQRSTSSNTTKASKVADGMNVDVTSAGNTRGNLAKENPSSSLSQPANTNAMSARARLLAKLPASSRGGVSGPRRMLVESPEQPKDKRGSRN